MRFRPLNSFWRMILMKFRLSNSFWGTILLLATALLVSAQIDGFAGMSVGIKIAVVLSLAAIALCVELKQTAPLPIPFVALYIIFQAPLKLPEIKPLFWIPASVLASAGLFLFSRQRRHNVINQTFRTVSGNYDNNPSVNVSFGAVNWHLSADNLKTVKLNCNYGALNVFFDQVVPGPNGVEVIIDCRFGGIDLIVPRHWRIIDNVNCNLGGVSIDKSFAATTGNAPRLTLTLTGNVSLGGVDVRYI